MAVGANPCGRPLPVLMYSKHIENWYELDFQSSFVGDL